MEGVLKNITSLGGLALCDTLLERLRILYTKIIDVFVQFPTDVAYIKYIEQITNEKLDMVKVEPDL
jgi:NADH dehydrogenase (ubiquinone) 1 alpha subcomplex subunit 5|uniref:Uncharacterized protein n=1 Tax=Castor canadensis TaxID=51338 RepID=A0A8C0WQ15_CASCN